MVTIAEPDVQVLATQIQGVSPDVNKWPLVIMIALGVGSFVNLLPQIPIRSISNARWIPVPVV